MKSQKSIVFYVFIDNYLRSIYTLNRSGVKEYVLDASLSNISLEGKNKSTKHSTNKNCLRYHTEEKNEMKLISIDDDGIKALKCALKNQPRNNDNVSNLSCLPVHPVMLCVPLSILFIKPLVNEMDSSKYYRQCVCLNFKKLISQNVSTKSLKNHNNQEGIILELFSKDSYKIDYAWGLRLWRQIHLCIERECAAAWLSTLGGAFSALGELSNKCAIMALKVSLRQIKLSVDSDDPDGVARGWLFLALALSQLGYSPVAFHLLKMAYSSPSYDDRHIKMCMGVEAKLKYDRKVRQQKKARGLLEKSESLEKVLKSMLKSSR